MIKIKYLPIRFEQQNNKEYKFDFMPKMPLLFYLDKTDIPYKECDIIVEGRVVIDLNEVVTDDVDIIITIKLKFPAIGAFIWWAFVTHWFTTLVFLATIYSAITIRKPSAPSFGRTGDDLDNTPTYDWTGMKTTQNVGTPIPVIYGRHAVAGNRINEYIWTDGDKNYLNTLLCLGEGEIDGVESIMINNNPSGNFDGIELAYRYGTNNQSVLPYFGDLHDVNSVSVALPYNDSHVYTTTLLDVEAFELHFSLPSGLYEQDSSTGALVSETVTLKIEYKLSADTSYILDGTLLIDARSRTAVNRVYRKEGLIAGKYDIRVTKTSADSTDYTQTDVMFDSVDEIRLDDLEYPNVALASIRALATDQLSGASPNYKVVVRGIKIRIPDIRTAPAGGGSEVDWEDYYYDPDAEQWKLFEDDSQVYWDEATYVTKWSANPIWCVRDLLTKERYGLGNYITSAEVDDVLNLENAKYSEERVDDGNGGYEKRFRLDIVIESEGKALDVLSQICRSFRAVILYAGGKTKIKIDKPEDPVQLFGMGNIISGSYSETWKAKRDTYNMIEVAYLDANKGYEDERIVIMDQASIAAGEPPRKLSVRIFTTKLSYAVREGNFILRALLNLTRTISFKANISAIACMAFDVISFSHDVPQIGSSGLVKTGSTTTSVVLDREVTIENGKSYRLLIYFADDSSEEKIVTNASGATSTITVSEAFSNAPAKYDKYSFGEINKVKKDYRLLSLSREENYEVTLSGLEYNEAIYTEGDLILPKDSYSALSLEPPSVTGLNLTEALVKMKDGTIENVIDVWFVKPSLVGYYVGTYARAKIYLSDDDGASWISKGETDSIHFQILGNIVDLQEYKVAVVSISRAGVETSLVDAPTSSISVLGKSAAPADVTDFIVNQDRDRMTFGWTLVADADVLEYEIRRGGDWESASWARRVSGDNHLTTEIQIAASQKFWIKAIDTSGNFSTNAISATITVVSIPYSNVVVAYEESPSWAGAKSGHLGIVMRVSIYQMTAKNLLGRVTVTYATATSNMISRVTVTS